MNIRTIFALLVVLASLGVLACPAFAPDPNAASGVAGKALTCEAQAREAYASCKGDAGDAGDDVACQRAAIEVYRACKADAGL